MEKRFLRNVGILLVFGSVTLAASMLLHPVGGSIEHLLKTTRVIILSHSLALLCIPLILVGFWGLTRMMGTGSLLSVMACVTMSFGLVAGMSAAAINGLALPLFLLNYQDATVAASAAIMPILRYSLALNHAFDYIYLGSVCLSTLCWAAAIVTSRKLPVWTGYFGMILSASAVFSLITGFKFLDLQGFRLFMLGNLIWTVSIGISLIMKSRHHNIA